MLSRSVIGWYQPEENKTWSSDWAIPAILCISQRGVRYSRSFSRWVMIEFNEPVVEEDVFHRVNGMKVTWKSAYHSL